MRGIVLTAGYDRSLHAIAIAELLLRSGIKLSGLVVVSHFSIERIRTVIRLRGVRPLFDYVLRRTDPRLSQSSKEVAPLSSFLKANDIRATSLSAWARNAGVRFVRVRHINHPRAVQYIQQTSPERVIYAGGGILRRPFVDACRGRILNAHAGPLPEIRGMNACEWSVLLGLPPSVSIHLIDPGIDTGKVLEIVRVPIKSTDGISSLRERCTTIGIENLVKWASAPLPDSVNTEAGPSTLSRLCFVLAPALRELLAQRIPVLVCQHEEQ